MEKASGGPAAPSTALPLTFSGTPFLQPAGSAGSAWTPPSISDEPELLKPAKKVSSSGFYPVYSRADIRKVLEGANPDRKFLVIFSSMKGCAPCQAMSPYLNRFMATRKEYSILYVDESSGRVEQDLRDHYLGNTIPRGFLVTSYTPKDPAQLPWKQQPFGTEVSSYLALGLSNGEKSAAESEAAEIRTQQRFSQTRLIRPEQSTALASVVRIIEGK